MCYYSIFNLTLVLDPKEPLADPDLIPLDECNKTVLISCSNGKFAPQLESLAVSAVDPTAGPSIALSLCPQLN